MATKILLFYDWKNTSIYQIDKHDKKIVIEVHYSK